MLLPRFTLCAKPAKAKFSFTFFLVFLALYGNSFAQTISPQAVELEFASLPLASTQDEIVRMRFSPSVTIHYDDKSEKTFPLSYQKLMGMGDKIGDGTIGLITDINGKAFTEKDGSQIISRNPDGSSFISTGGRHFLITHMENQPGELYKTELKLDKQQLLPINTAPVDLRSTAGTLINCASTKTPWGSHLGGEEDYSLNSILADPASPHFTACEFDKTQLTGKQSGGRNSYFCSYISNMQKYLGDSTITAQNAYNGDQFTVYNYGYTIEVKVNEDGSTSSAKHYVTGKYTPELGIVMPDQKTVYMSDDGTAKGFWKFVSDQKINNFNPNWSGSLFAAKLEQLDATKGGQFNMSWIKLGHSSDNEIKDLIKNKPRITDIFDIKAPQNKQCPAQFTPVFEDGMLECLRLKKGQELEAAFLESRKYAAYLGASIEFRKEEGLTFDPVKRKLYVAMSQVSKSMEDNYHGLETSNDIRLPINNCGAVYELSLDDKYSVTSMKALVVGQALLPVDPDANRYYCSPNSISNPDNIAYIGMNTLLISEDTAFHVNNMSWAYNTSTGKLTRIASLPIGAEITGVATANIDSHGFLFMNQQHPFADGPINAKGQNVFSHLIENASDQDQKAIIGYVSGFPSDVLSD